MKNIKKFLSFFLVLLMTVASLANTGFEIKAASKQAVVYYYNTNWTKANIHYKVGNGNWTSVPGVAMEKSSEQSGYNWKYVIDLGSADEATVCFNNGNGDWDSRNAKNYTVKAGTYGIKNQSVNELSTVTPTPTPEFKTTISANTTSGTIDTTFRFVGKSYNEAGHRYNAHYFSIKDVNTGKFVEECLYALVDEDGYITSWKPTTEGTYEVTFFAREYCGRLAQSSMIVTVKDNAVKATIAADKTSVKVGTPVKLTATVENEVGHRYNTHLFYVTDLATGEVEYSPTLSAYGPNFSYTWTPKKAGTYEASFKAQEYGSSRGDVATIKITVKDVTKNTVKVYYNNSNWSQANIHYQVGNGNWTAVPGVRMQASDNSRYTWMYTIDLGDANSANICFNNGNGSWDSRNSANYHVGTGTYEVIYGSANKIAD